MKTIRVEEQDLEVIEYDGAYTTYKLTKTNAPAAKAGDILVLDLQHQGLAVSQYLYIIAGKDNTITTIQATPLPYSQLTKSSDEYVLYRNQHDFIVVKLTAFDGDYIVMVDDNQQAVAPILIRKSITLNYQTQTLLGVFTPKN